MGEVGLGLALLSLAIWVGLLTLWGNFWRCDQRLEEGGLGIRDWGLGGGDQGSGFGVSAQSNGVGGREESEQWEGQESGVRSQASQSVSRRESGDNSTSIQNPTSKIGSDFGELSRTADGSPEAQKPSPSSLVRLSAHVEAYSLLPTICAVIPARNEADVIARAARSLLTQTYPGSFQVVLVDDQSTDGTGEVAEKVAAELEQSERLTVLRGEPLAAGWTGKLWAMEQGVRYTQTLDPLPDYILFTDADIEHDRHNLNQLVSKALQDDLDLVSLMVLLRCESFWEKLLIPAFVFFFQKLYPFPLSNNPKSRVAAAAGGCILLRRETLEAIGGLQILRQALIDDCSLARAVKGRRQENSEQWIVDFGVSAQSNDGGQTNSSFVMRHSSLAEDKGPSKIQNPKSKIGSALRLELRSKAEPSRQNQKPKSPSGKIWLGLTQTTRSLRPYEKLETIWNMVARTAYTQLNYSPWLLAGTLVGMVLVYLVLPISTIAGLLTGHWAIALVGLSGWALMTVAYLPTIRLYGLSPLWAVSLPAIALLYNLMTLDSALRHWRGQGGAWKGRVYPTGE